MTYVLIDWLSLQAIAFCSCFFMDIDVMERVPESWMFGQVNRKNQSEEIQRFLNLMWNKFQSGQSGERQVNTERQISNNRLTMPCC